VIASTISAVVMVQGAVCAVLLWRRRMRLPGTLHAQRQRERQTPRGRTPAVARFEHELSAEHLRSSPKARQPRQRRCRRGAEPLLLTTTCRVLPLSRAVMMTWSAEPWRSALEKASSMTHHENARFVGEATLESREDGVVGRRDGDRRRKTHDERANGRGKPALEVDGVEPSAEGAQSLLAQLFELGRDGVELAGDARIGVLRRQCQMPQSRLHDDEGALYAAVDRLGELVAQRSSSSCSSATRPAARACAIDCSRSAWRMRRATSTCTRPRPTAHARSADG
jgi:hypothetical protein